MDIKNYIENLTDKGKGICHLICTLKRDNGNTNLKLANGETLDFKAIKKYNKKIKNSCISQTYKALKNYYTEIIKINDKDPELSVVWLLIGNEKECIQVGSNCDLHHMLYYDIAPNIGVFIYSPNKKNKEKAYGELLDKYETLEFYEVNIDKYLEKENIPLSVEITDPAANRAKYMILAGWAEGKIACDLYADKRLFHVSSIGVDKYSFEYYLPNRTETEN